jgi:hypothetical protein
VKMALVGAGLAVAALVGVIPVPPAHADDADDGFILALQMEGIEGPRDALIDAAHQICTKLQAGDTPIQVVDWVTSQTQLPSDSAKSLIGAAAATYCFDQVGNVKAAWPTGI